VKRANHVKSVVLDTIDRLEPLMAESAASEILQAAGTAVVIKLRIDLKQWIPMPSDRRSAEP
jgi:hypothetical protein